MQSRRGLGPFELEEAIGEGGMGFVYRARHGRTGMPAAIKVIRGAGRQQEVENFHREVEAHARLVHPGVVTLFEYGRVDEEAVAASGGNIVEGSPFVAMEFARRGTVQALLPLSSWSDVRAILLQVLDGLAYAHARGVVHRDLKPENFLVFEAEAAGAEAGSEEEPAARVGRIKLADFGIAHAFAQERSRDTGELRAVSGTPYYMPPEQLRGQWRRYGPWTDMYALGCIAWELVCGEPPFDAPSAMALGLKHETEERPELDPQFPVPEGAESWIHRAMSVAPDDRFQRAADAAAALPGEQFRAVPADESNQTDDDDERVAPTVRQTDGPQFEAVAPTLQLSESERPEDDREFAEPSSSEENDPALLSGDRTSLPDSWCTDRDARNSAPMVDTGLGLFGLREIPFVDRVPERDDLWSRLQQVIDDGGFSLTILSGNTGSGKSRLAEWMVRRAHEVGATENFRARHAPDGNGSGDGLAGLVARKFHTWNMERRAIRKHLEETLPQHADASMRSSDIRALTELLRPTDEQEKDKQHGSTYRFSNHEQRYALMERLLERFARQRTPAIWIDDLQWSADTIGWLDFMLKSQNAPRAWVVATVRRDVLADRPTVAAKIDELVDSHESCRRTHVDPLTFEEHRELIERLLPLAPEAVDTVARQTEGNPLFAVQLVEDWVERGRLQVGEEGFELDDPTKVELPSDIHDLWMQRLARTVQQLRGGESLWRLMELAATLGREIDDNEWVQICSRADLQRADELVPALVDRGLARRMEAGWAWTHGMLVASLRRRADEANRLADHHRRCARLLELLDRPSRQTASRRANHWIEAGAYDEALAPLLDEAERLVEQAAVEQARPVLEKRSELLDALGRDASDTAWLEQLRQEAELEYNAGHFTEVRDRVDRIRDSASGDPGAIIRADAERLAGNCEVMESNLEAGRSCYQRAIQCLEGVSTEVAGASETLGRVYGGLAALELDAGDTESADRYAQKAVEAAELAELPYDRLAARRVQAWAAVDAGANDRAEDIFQEIYREAQEYGFRDLQADCVNGLGGLASHSGDKQRAREWYERYVRMGRELARDSHVVVAKLNIAESYAEEGNFGSAQPFIEEAEELIETGASIRRDDFIRCLRLACAAGEGRGEVFDSLFEAYEDGWPEEARSHSGHAATLEAGGEAAIETLGTQRAVDMLRLSQELWRRIGQAERAEKIARRLETLTE